MNIVSFLKKIGLLRAGTEKGSGPLLGDFYGADDKDRKQEPADPKELLETEKESPPAAAGVGRAIAFGVAATVGVLVLLLFFFGYGISIWSILALLTWVGFILKAKSFAFERTSSWAAFSGLFVGTLLISFLLLAAVTPDGITTTDGSSADSNPVGTLAIGDLRFTRPDAEGLLQPVTEAVYQRGEQSSLVFARVSGFEIGEDGRHWYDYDFSLKDGSGQELIFVENVLGEDGRKTLPEGTARAIPVVWSTSDITPVGRYTITVTLKDRISGASETVSKTYTLR